MKSNYTVGPCNPTGNPVWQGGGAGPHLPAPPTPCRLGKKASSALGGHTQPSIPESRCLWAHTAMFKAATLMVGAREQEENGGLEALGADGPPPGIL